MRYLPLLLSTALLTGCGTFADPTEWFGGADVVEPAELVELQNRVEPQLLWKRDVGAGTNDLRLNLEPRVVGDTVYVADGEGEVHALALDSGRNRWQVDLEVPLSGGPGGGDELVLLGTSDAEVIALSAASGEPRWRTSVSSEVLSVPAISNGVVVVHTVDGKLFGLEATSGTERWRYERAVPTLTLRGSASPVLDGGVAYVGMAGGKLVALRVDNGSLLWDTDVTVPSGRSELERLADIDGEPVLLGGGIFVATYQGEVAALDQRSGRVAWRHGISSYGRLAVDPKGVYVADADGRMWGLDIRSGEPLWSQDALQHRRLSDVAVLEDLVVVGDYQGYLHWLDRADGSLVARSRVGSDPITTGLRVVGDVLYVQGDGGDLAAVRLPADR